MAEGETEAQEKTHDATPRRLEKAREQGDLPRSQEAQTLASYIGLALAIFVGGSWSAVTMGEALMPTLSMPGSLALDLVGGGDGSTFRDLIGRVLLAATPAVALPAALILALLIAQRGIVVVPDKLLPKLSRISPIENAKQKYGLKGLVEFVKSVAKITAVGAVLYLTVANALPEIAQTPALGHRALGTLLAERFEAIMIGLLIVTSVIAFLDVAWQNFDFMRRNRMSHQEVKEETKTSEGDPHLRAERRSRARDIAAQKMLLDVPKADVVITNPTHYAIALVWNKAPGSAPKCVAKGVDEIALRIRELAEAAGVPVHSDPPTARSIHALVEVGQEVHPDHYKAVAAAILFAERMRSKAAGVTL